MTKCFTGSARHFQYQIMSQWQNCVYTRKLFLYVHSHLCVSGVGRSFKSSTSDRTNTKHMQPADTSYSVHKFTMNLSFRWLSGSGWEVTQLWHFKGQKGRKFNRAHFRSCRCAVIIDRHQNVPECLPTLKRHFLLYTSYHVRYKINKFEGKQKERSEGKRMLKK